MRWLILWFVAANALDAGITHYCLTSDQPVAEGNPLVSFITAHAGWQGFWAFKLLVPILFGLSLHFGRRPESAKRIMLVCCVAMTAVVLYSPLIVLWSNFEAGKY